MKLRNGEFGINRAFIQEEIERLDIARLKETVTTAIHLEYWETTRTCESRLW
jgi:hypothetical protein